MRSIGVRAAAVAVVHGVILGCGQPVAPPAPADSVVTVEIGTAVVDQVTDYQDFTGRIEAVNSVEIQARVSGYLNMVAFDASIESGAEVEKDAVLFQIDDRPYQIALQSANAQLADAEARLKQATADLARTEELIKKNAATQADLDRDVAKKLLSEAAIASANAAIAQANLDLEFTQIKAPIKGRISRALPSIGDLITPSQGILTTIVSVEPMQVYFDMDEPTLLQLQKRIREGSLQAASEQRVKLQLGLQTDSDFPYPGFLDFVDNRVDASTGTMRVRGEFENPKPVAGPRPLAPGMFARVRLLIGEPHPAVLIPERAISRDQGQPFVYVVNDENEAVYRRVTLGAMHEKGRIVTDGLTASERIIINGLQRVRPGGKVKESEVGGSGQWSGGRAAAGASG